jgi:uncharacterized protein YcbK (DUF882 family)
MKVLETESDLKSRPGKTSKNKNNTVSSLHFSPSSNRSNCFAAFQKPAKKPPYFRRGNLWCSVAAKQAGWAATCRFSTTATSAQTGGRKTVTEITQSNTVQKAGEQIFSGPGFDRRAFLRAGLAFAAWMCPAITPAEALLPHAARQNRLGGERSLVLANVHTGETFRGVYWQNGHYVPGAFAEIKSVLRDHRTGERFPIDPRLMDLLYVLQGKLENRGAVEILSGYRSPDTNRRLRHFRRGAALHSLHMVGQACDIRLPGTRLSSLHHAARRLGLGGVGYYPESEFVHVDTGVPRHWLGV